MNSPLDYINNNLKPLNTLQTISDASELFIDYSFLHFPVLENGIYIGSISKDDTETLEQKTEISSIILNLERFYARNSMSWLDIQELFARNSTNVMPVLDENNTYIGFYEMEDLIHLFNETPFLKEEGGTLIIQKNISDFSMSQVVQIIESNNSKLLGLFISRMENNIIEITLKVNLGNLNDIIQTLRRFEYEILSHHQEDSYIESLKERSEYLDKYLNI